MLDKVVEEVGAQRDIGDQRAVHRHHLADGEGAGDPPGAHRDAERRAAGAPAAGPHQQQVALRVVALHQGLDQLRHRIAILFGKGRVAGGWHVEDVVDGAFTADADDGAVGFQDVRAWRGGRVLFAAGHGLLDLDLEGAALQQVDVVGAVRQEVEGELDVHRVAVGLAQQRQHAPQVVRDRGRGLQQPAERHPRHAPRRRVDEQVGRKVAAQRHQGFDGEGHQLAGLEVEDVDPALGMVELFVLGRFGPPQRGVEGDQARVVVVRAVHRAGAQPEDQAGDPGLGVDLGVPAVRIVRKAHAGRLREEIAVATAPRDAHDQQGHAFLAGQQVARLAVKQGLGVEHAGVHLAHRVEQGGEAFLAGPAVGEEDALVLAGKSVAARVLEDRTGAHDARHFPEVLEHRLELLDLSRQEFPGENPGTADVEVLEEGGRPVLLLADPPHAVAHHEADEHLRPHEERVVHLDPLGHVGRVAPQDGPRHQHPERLAADRTDPDLALADLPEILQRQVLLHQRGDTRAVHAVGPADPLQGGLLDPRREFAGPLLAEHALDILEQPAPVADQVVLVEARQPRARQDPGEDRTFLHGQQAVAFLHVERVHGGARAALDLDRPDVALVLEREHVEQELRRVADHVDGGRRVGVADD